MLLMLFLYNIGTRHDIPNVQHMAQTLNVGLRHDGRYAV